MVQYTSRVTRKKYVNISNKLVAGPSQVKVGFPAGSTNVDKAIWNEFGTRGGGWGGPIPERPFMRNSLRNNTAKYKSMLKKSAAQIVTGKASVRVVLARLGITAQQDIQTEITSLRSPPNAAMTIALKGSSNPLIDTGEMRQSVTWKYDE